MSMRCMRNTKGSVGSTAEPRTQGKMRLGNGPLPLCQNDRRPSLRSNALVRAFPPQPHRKTATEIMMGQERDYRESLLGDMEVAQRKSGHPNVRSYYEVIKQMPRTNGILNEHRNHVGVLEGLDAPNGNMYYSERDEFYVDEWSIQTPEIYHRHKELGEYSTRDGMDFTGYHEQDLNRLILNPNYYRTHIQWDAAHGLCGLCGVQMPGEILMMHKFYQF